MGFNVLSESACIVKQTMVSSVCIKQTKKKLVCASLLNINCFVISEDGKSP